MPEPRACHAATCSRRQRALDGGGGGRLDGGEPPPRARHTADTIVRYTLRFNSRDQPTLLRSGHTRAEPAANASSSHSGAKRPPRGLDNDTEAAELLEIDQVFTPRHPPKGCPRVPCPKMTAAARREREGAARRRLRGRSHPCVACDPKRACAGSPAAGKGRSTSRTTTRASRVDSGGDFSGREPR